MNARLEADAVRDLGPGPGRVTTGFAPGRCTLAGEHVDYAGGLVCCMAIGLGIGVAVREDREGRFHVRSGPLRAGRGASDGLRPRGDVADRPLACVEALRRGGVEVPPVRIAVAADLPAGAGLSSSAALSCAVLVALLRLVGGRVSARELAQLALVAERDVVGVPCGPLDQLAVTMAPRSGALLLDCASRAGQPLPWGVRAATVVACDTGEAHDVAGAGYRTRRREADAALRALGAPTWRDVDAACLAAADLPPPLDRRARHIVAETRRAAEAARALAAGDAEALGAVILASHASLRDDCEVSTARLDAVVGAALEVPGCHGARLVGAGFGGAVVALVAEAAVDRCGEAMRRAAGPSGGRTWRLDPAPGVAAVASDVVVDGGARRPGRAGGQEQAGQGSRRA